MVSAAMLLMLVLLSLLVMLLGRLVLLMVFFVGGDGYDAGEASGSVCTGSIFGVYASNLSDGGTTGSHAVYGRGILVECGSSSGTDQWKCSCRWSGVVSCDGRTCDCQDGGSGVIMV